MDFLIYIIFHLHKIGMVGLNLFVRCFAVGCTISSFLTLSVLPSMVSDVFLVYIATLIN